MLRVLLLAVAFAIAASLQVAAVHPSAGGARSALVTMKASAPKKSEKELRLEAIAKAKAELAAAEAERTAALAEKEAALKGMKGGLSLPEVSFPKIELPSFSAPSVKAPSLTVKDPKGILNTDNPAVKGLAAGIVRAAQFHIR